MSSYNQKLFSGGARGRLHRMRFNWLRKNLTEQPDGYTLFELGCFDCRSLEYLPKPASYVGADANWEGGLNDAQMTFHKFSWMELVMSQSVHDLASYAERRFDYSIALETLEHIPDAVLQGYIEFLARVTKKKLFITVPVEIGPVFLAKYLAKKTFSHLGSEDTQAYRLEEVIAATCCRTAGIERFEHKGFDYRRLVVSIGQHFTITRVEGIPFTRFPGLSFQVGIIAEPKTAFTSTMQGVSA